MPLIYVVLALIVIGMGLWLINNYVPMAGSIRTHSQCCGGDLRLRLAVESV